LIFTFSLIGKEWQPQIDGNSFCTLRKRKKAFGFEYDKDWIKTASQRLIDPDIQFFRVHNFQTIKKILEFF
jgi:hypothetical protein